MWCANAYPLHEWPDLIGLGSMCRRHLHGDVGIFAVIDALDRILPPNVKFHLFGVKGKALEHLGQHPRIASVDSMAWEAAARRDHPTGRNMDLRGEYMLSWAEKNKAAAAGVQVGRTPSLLPVEPERVNSRIERWLDLVTSNEITGPDAHWAALRNFDQLDDHTSGEEEGCGMGMT